MKLKLMIALVILALVVGMSFIACDDGDLPVIKNNSKDDGSYTETIYDITLLGSGVNSSDKHKDELLPDLPDTTGNWIDAKGKWDSSAFGLPDLPF
jgi:hypothetical protein